MDNQATEGAFSGLIDAGMSLDETPEREGEESQATETVNKADYDALKAKLDEVTNKIPDQDQLQRITENNEKLEKLKEVFVPNESKISEEKRREELAAFDRDPIKYMEERMDEKIAVIAERQANSDVDRYAKEVMAEVDKEYVVDWKKDGEKIANQLAKFNTDFKRKDPKAATVEAMRLAGVGKKRDAAANFPFYESSDYAAAQEKARESEADAYRSSLREAAKQMSQSPLKGFWEN